MTHVQPTVLDVARAIARLDEHADVDTVKRIDGLEWSKLELRQSVAGMIAFQWARHAYGDTIKSRARVTKHDVAVVMAALGATPMTIQLHAHAIAGLIRADFKDGMG